MKNMFNKANMPYLVSSTLAIATLLASGVFAAAPYAGFLAPVAVLGFGLPFIIGGAVSSALVFALSAVVISRNKTISERDTKISSLKGQLAKKEKVIEAKNKTIVNPNKDDELKRQHRKEKQKEILDSEALSNLFREKPKSNVVAKAVEGKANQVVKSVGTVAYALTMLNLATRLPFIPVSTPGASTELFGQQTSPSQTYGTSTVNLSSAHYVPTPQVVLESKANEYEQTLDNAFKSAKNNFGILQNSSEPQWFKDLNKSETTEEIIDGGTLPNLFYEDSNSDYQFAKPSITHAESSKTVGSNQTTIAKYSGANTGFANYLMGTYGRFLKNLNPFGSREHSVQGSDYQCARSNAIHVENVGSLLNFTELSKLTTERPFHPDLGMVG